MDKKVCIITGANSGIGKQSAIQMAQAGYYVIIACRNNERGKKALEEIKDISKSQFVELIILDLSLRSSTKAFANEVIQRFDKIDVMIHNAAIFDISQKEVKFTEEGNETVWMTNHVNPVYLTYLLLDKIKASDNGRIITVSSKGLLATPFLKINLEDPEFRNRKFSMQKAYYQSKRAQIMFTYYLARELADTNVTVNCIRVTAVKIDLSRFPNISGIKKWIYKKKSNKSITPEKMAKSYTFMATNEKLKGITGKYFNEKNQIVDSNKYSKDETNIIAVMALTKKYFEEEVCYERYEDMQY